MPRGLVQTAAPGSEPVTLADAKQWARIDVTDDDALVSSLITAARAWVEQTTNRQLLTATFQATYDRFPRYSSSAVWQFNSDAIWQQRLPVTQLSGQWYPDRAAFRLPRPPLASVSSITYTDGTGTPQTLDPSTYNLDTTTEPGRVAPSFGNIWPIVRQQLASVTVTYVAGYGATAASVPEPFKVAIKLLVGHWYENREAVGNVGRCVELAVHSLLSAYWPAEYE